MNFSEQSGVPSQWGIHVKEVVMWFYQQAGKLEGLQLKADGLKKGVFSDTAFTKETEAAPLREKKTRSKPAVWATIHRAGFGRMMEVDNS